MAQTYTLTKSVTLSVNCTGTRTSVINPNDNNIEYYFEFPYAVFETKYVDFSEIPNNATISSVSLQKSGDSASGSKSYFLKDAGGQNIGTISTDNIREYITSGGRKVGLMLGFQASRKGPYMFATNTTMSVSNTITYTISVTYEVANASIINYGTKEGFVPCSIHYCDNGTYKPCRAFYGTNGEWIEVGQY